MPTLPQLTPKGRLYAYLFAAIACTIFADFLFYDHVIGISLVVFFAAIGTLSACLNAQPGRLGQPKTAYVLFVASQLPIIEDFDLLPCLFAVMGLAAFVVTMRRGRPIAVRELVPLSAILILSGLARTLIDFTRWTSLSLRRRAHPITRDDVVAWIVPLVVGIVFLVLLRAANPLIEEGIAAIDLGRVLTRSAMLRVMFWIFVLIAIWPVIRVRAPRDWVPRPTVATVSAPVGRDGLLGRVAVKRSLVLFNVLFAAQSCMDLMYLWGGATLPHGMTYATYAHRGAYPLMATALLAAAFVLMATRTSKSDRIIRTLLLVWVGQNILLVISSIMRLNLYVAAYSLTELRLHAFIWMLLVAIGLVLIVVRIVRDKSSSWLVMANIGALVLTLYATSFVDLPMAVATYNLRHAQECGGGGQPLDTDYFLSLPPRTLMAIDACQPIAILRQERDDWIASMHGNHPDWRMMHRWDWFSNHPWNHPDWRSWSFRQWRLDRALANLPQSP